MDNMSTGVLYKSRSRLPNSSRRRGRGLQKSVTALKQKDRQLVLRDLKSSTVPYMMIVAIGTSIVALSPRSRPASCLLQV